MGTTTTTFKNGLLFQKNGFRGSEKAYKGRLTDLKLIRKGEKI